MMGPQGNLQSPGMSVSVRPMNESEREALKSVPKPHRNNAVGISILSMVMAIMVNFVEDQVAMVMPLFFCFIGLGLALQARKSSGSVAQALAKGTVSDVRGTLRFKGAGGWEIGTLSVPKDKQLEGLFVDGLPATVTVAAEAQRVVSVNGVTLKKPAMLRMPAGALDGYVVSAPMQMPVRAHDVQEQDTPPPPDGWTPARHCPKCGQSVSGDVMFCERCGQRLKA